MAEASRAGALSRAAFDASLPTLETYAAIPCLSPSFDPDWAEHGALDAAVALLAEWTRSQAIPGLSVSIERLERRTPMLVAELPASSGASDRPTTLIYGHFDKQPPLGEWRAGLGAFTPVREADRLYGRGTADDGYATFAAISALAGLVEARAPHGRVLVCIEGSEESGSPDLEAHLERLVGRFGDLGLVICLDSGCATYDRLWVTTSLRGVLVGVLRVEVLSEGVHSGHAGGIVPSSFRIARELLERIEDSRSGQVLPPELETTIPAHRVREIAEVAEEIGEAAAGVFPLVPGLELAGATVAERITNGTWRAALEVTGQAGIPAVADGGNVLRPSTSLKLSVRLPPNADATRAADALVATLEADPPSGARVRFEIEAQGTGWDAPALDPWLDAAVTDASLAYFGKPPRSLGLGGSIPFMAALGRRYPRAQFLATGVLGPESNAHGPNEFLHLPTASAVTAVVTDVLARLGRAN